jgi:hypothetical protein
MAARAASRPSLIPESEALLADPATNRADSDTLAWKTLQGRIDHEAKPSDSPTENAVRVAPVLVMPSRDFTLFATLPPQGQGPGTFLGSIFVHVLAAAVVWFSLIYKPPVTRVIEDHLSVRQLDLRSPDEQKAEAAPRIPYPKRHPDNSARAGQKQEAPPPPPPAMKAQPGPQTLIQADLLNPVTLPQIVPVPQAVIWSPSKTVAKKITPPLPEKPTAANVIPSLERPNEELNLADVNLASSNLPSHKMPVAPSTTSPIASHVPSPVQMPPASASQQTAPPTPAAVLSLSDLRLKDGTAALPPVNESLASKVQGTMGTTPAQTPSAEAGKGAPGAKPGENGTSQNAGAPGNHPGTSSAGKPETASPASGSETAPDAMGRLTSTPIALPKDGHFGSVLVNDAIEQQFPEMEGIWSGRMAYTAYLHVGLSKSWIMQYSLPANAEAAAGGSVSRLEAPWPYNIVRPNFAPGSIDADALMIRGYVDPSGRFQDLSIVFPQPFSSAQFVLNTLKQWQFRPATQNGQAVRVEVLLIIPEEMQ